MSQFKDDVVAAETVYFWFAANLTTGAAGDGATPLYDVRLAGAASSAAPTASGTPTLLTHANYTDGLHEIAIDTTGYANGEYAVFCTLTISTVNPAGFVGSFKVRTANRIDAIKTKTDFLPSVTAGNAGGVFIAGTNAATTITTSLTTTFTGNLTGSVASVTGAVGSVTGLTASNLDATVSSRATQTSVDDLPTNAELATALGTADDAVLTAIADLPTNAELATALGTADDAVLAVLGTPAGASVSADMAAMKVDTAAILVDTAEIGAAGAGLTNINLPNQTMDITGNITGNLSGSVGSVTGAVGSVTGAVGSVTGLTASDVGAIKTKTDSLTFTKALEVDANIQSINGTTVLGDGGATPWGP